MNLSQTVCCVWLKILVHIILYVPLTSPIRYIPHPPHFSLFYHKNIPWLRSTNKEAWRQKEMQSESTSFHSLPSISQHRPLIYVASTSLERANKYISEVRESRGWDSDNCEIWGSYCIVAENSYLVGCYSYQHFKWAQCHHLQCLAATGLPSFENIFSYLTVNKLLHPKRLECSFCLLFIIKQHLTEKGAGDVDIHPGHTSMNETHFEFRNMKFCIVVKLTCTHCDRSWVFPKHMHNF